MSTIWAAQTLTCPNSCVYLLPKSIAKVRQVSVVKDLLSIQIFHRQRIYQADCKDLIHSLFSCMERFPFFLLSCTALGAQLSFWPQLYMWATLPTEVRGVKSTSLLGYLTQASEGYGGQRWGVHQVPMVAVTCRELQQTGPSLWWESFPVSAEAGAGMWRQWWPCPL